MSKNVISDDGIGISPSHCLTYAMPVMAVHFLYGPVAILQGIYAKYFGVALTTIASVILIARLFDAFSDPLIGYVSDSYCRRVGNRKPFIVFGAILLVVSSYFLYVPIDPELVTSDTRISKMYFLGWFLAFYLSFTLFEIPHLAWGGEIAKNSLQKNSIYTFRTLFMFLGHILFFLLPLLPVFNS
ncbi:MFS transporter, partial [Porticoccaceae bacterium]|nr:MFS transporter [Porticoccaceae bacterium]